MTEPRIPARPEDPAPEAPEPDPEPARDAAPERRVETAPGPTAADEERYHRYLRGPTSFCA